ncbi:hypothetical protein Tco_0674751 [Tanacetum coccineum]
MMQITYYTTTTSSSITTSTNSVCLPVTSETIQEIIPLLVAGFAHHDGVIDEVLHQMDELPPEHTKLVNDDVETMRIRLTSVEQETMSLRGISETLEQHDEDSQNEDIMHLQRAEILGQDVEALHARAEAAKQ